MFEPDVFYNLCDELGILVWQDCRFSRKDHQLMGSHVCLWCLPDLPDILRVGETRSRV